MTVIGVTGTDGKTTTTTLIYEMLKAAGLKVGMISTVVAKIGEETINMALHVTNPEAKVLQGILRKMADAGCTHVVLEVTSHGLDQNRTVGCNFQIGVLTNISHEHLDYHKGMQDYVAAKAKLFGNVKHAVLNEDDKWFAYFKSQITRNKKQTIIQYSKSKTQKVSPALGGEYNQYNIGAAEAVCKALGMSDEAIEKTVKNFAGVPGRREEVDLGQKFRAIVDFAHTPNALEQLLMSLRENLGKGKLILVFGCTGERDRDKRPIMGKAAEKWADKIVVTSDDVRGESQDKIYEQIVAGMENAKKVVKENDRDKAIEMAVKMAREGDVIVAAGMGHETTQLIGKTEVRRSDREAFEKAIMGMVR